MIGKGEAVTAQQAYAKQEQLAKLFIDTRSFLWNAEPIYPLASGAMSDHYIDCKIALSHPDVRALIGEMIIDRLGSAAIDAVGGLALGAYPIAIAVSDAFYRKLGKTVRGFVVRKEPKPHGLKKHIEGDVKPGDRVLVVDDVITTGNSTIDAIMKCRAERLDVVKVIALIDRQERSGAQRIRDCGVTFEALLTFRDLCDVRGSASEKWGG
jgi:orotate phosphoribosyltransferase